MWSQVMLDQERVEEVFLSITRTKLCYEDHESTSEELLQ
jgi:hypothetical protein